jgi:glutamate 5-kinase
MKTKLRAAKMCREAGCDMIIANGDDPALLYRLVSGERVGTRFIAKRG